ncbi:FkbM family methyltransferase [Pseudomarimonas salicorniae]|uniref:FkbM family methyltransferase n=1 Tax=Pseudomarimonas salicorniae TaxID=2933270 RepID=A0ABT0GIT1_9GAMM|nr:FkbM family methyltransferase [Lysobacter sp. CAU 1642]MCK7594461.1 FkbM family methyltransferase [Lysobacter sp. CAU 1642]
MIREIRIAGQPRLVESDDRYLEQVGVEFEPHMVQLFRALLGNDEVVCDIGANLGLTALFFSSVAKQTYAFEPSPTTFKFLSQNLSRNGIGNVEALNIGLGECEAETSITFATNNRSGAYVSEKVRPSQGHTTECIKIRTLDSVCGERNLRPTFLKLDVEGFEQSVLRGARRVLSDCQPTVVLEMNHFCLDVLQRITIPDFLDFLRSVFPVLHAVDADNRTIVDLHVPDGAYMVMHEHVVRNRFPNLVGGFDSSMRNRLQSLSG